MLYSCFNEQVGLYRYFADDKHHAINADQPVPKLPATTGRVGVPSIDAARPFPSGAKPIGQGWHARGLVVQCPGRGMGQVQLSDGQKNFLRLSMVLAAGVIAAMWVTRHG